MKNIDLLIKEKIVMKKKIKSLFYSLSVASFILLGCTSIPIEPDYSCLTIDDTSSQAVTEAKTQSGFEKSTEENNIAESTEANEKSKKKQLKDLRELSRDIKNAKIKIEDLNATSSELKELSNRIKAVDDILKKF